MEIDAAEWDDPGFDLLAFDAAVDELAACASGNPYLISIDGDLQMAEEILTRCLRLADRRNGASRSSLFERVLARHREIHDLTKPLVRADHSHALDVWQWTLRLEPDAGLAVQIAALFHDIERLASEADARIEQHAADYQQFKDAHARIGAAWTDEILGDLGGDLEVDAETRRAAVALVGRHEHPPAPGDSDAADLALLNDADALSFFSLNSPGYWNYYGPEASRGKIAWTLARMRPESRRWLRGMRLHSEVAREVARIVEPLTSGAERRLVGRLTAA
jgi:hypothetical protein